MQEQLLTIREVATRLRVDTSTVRRWIITGVLAAVVLPHPGKRRIYRVKAATVEALLMSNSTVASTVAKKIGHAQ